MMPMTTNRAQQVLIVDDEPASIEILASALPPDCEVLYDLSGSDALARLESGDLPDMVLLDVRMPGLNGYEVCRRLKREPRTRNLPVIIITAQGDLDSEISALESGASDFIPKPINLRVVRLRVGLQLLLHRREEDLQRLNAELEQRVSERTQSLSDALQRAETANRAKSAFLANMGHELRTPLNGIIGMTDILKRKETDPDTCRRLDAVLKSANDLTRVLNNVLEHARLEANLLLLEPTAFSVPDLSAQLGAMTGPLAAAKNLQLQIDLESLPPRLVGDVTQLTRILWELLGNAIKFTQQGEVRLEAEVIEARGDRLHVLFTVTDTGCGIPPGRQADIFEPFEQMDGSLTRAHGGTGLGLTIARQLAALMNGKVVLTASDASGSTFAVELWLKEATERPEN